METLITTPIETRIQKYRSNWIITAHTLDEDGQRDGVDGRYIHLDLDGLEDEDREDTEADGQALANCQTLEEFDAKVSSIYYL